MGAAGTAGDHSSIGLHLGRQPHVGRWAQDLLDVGDMTGVGEVVREGLSIGKTTGADYWIGLPPEEHARVATRCRTQSRV